MVGPSDSIKIIWPNGFNSDCFQLHISQNVATSMPSLTSQSCSNSQRAVCLARKLEPFSDHLSTRGCQTGPWMPDRPVNEATVKADRRTLGNGIGINC